MKIIAINFALNYITKFNDDVQIDTNFQFENSAEEQFTFISRDYVVSEDVKSKSHFKKNRLRTEDQLEYLLQADYVLPIGNNARFEAGYHWKH
jgi:hypothetical protein